MVLNNMYIECTNIIGFLYIDIIKQNVQEFERVFQLQASPTYETKQNISDKFLKIAAEQFIYLNHCPDTKTNYFMTKISMSSKPKVSNLFEVLMFGSYGAGDLDPKALNKLIGNQCLGPFYCTLGTGSCKP